jgi:superfamily II DNA helicase RecQ
VAAATPTKKSRHSVFDKIEISPSGRAACRKCKEKIAKGDRRVDVVGHISKPGYGYTSHQYYHDKCYPDKSGLVLDTATPKELNEKSKALKERRRLREQIRTLRMELANRLEVEPYKIYPDKTLDDIVVKLPKKPRPNF